MDAKSMNPMILNKYPVVKNGKEDTARTIPVNIKSDLFNYSDPAF